jgi:PAS domain S-box-containing protein
MNKITPADISDPQEVIARAKALSAELDTPITPGFEALVFKASRGIEDIYELTYIRKDGSRFPAVVSVTALRDAQNTIIGYLLIGTDNTARKQVEAEQMLLDQRLRDQQFYTRSLIESNIDAIMATDPKGIITDVNKQMEALTGCTRDELIGAPVKKFFTDPARAEASIKLALSEKQIINYELTARARDGKETVVSYNATTFYDRDRKLQGVFGAAREVTELKRFERALQEKNVELEHATRMKSEFLATMSHELRTPLNAIIGFSEALKDGLMGEMDATQKEYIGDIHSSGQHLLSLINDILDLSKVEAGMMTLELEEVDLSSLLANSLSIVKEKAAAHHLQLELETGADLGVPRLDMRKTKQIVYNLLANAVKFTPSGGRVTLRARRVPRSAVGKLPGPWPVHAFPLADSEFADFLEIFVRDSGIGISEKNMEKLFQPFSQIDSSLARKYEGTGLGLAMVKQMAELHGGSVAVASAEGEGASFAAWLPLRAPGAEAAAPPQATDAATEAATGAAAAPAERIALVIEDDEQAADLIQLLLEAEGFSVLRAASAEAALLLAPQQTLSLITLDIQLPGIDGWEFLQQVREDSSLARVPVLVVSGRNFSNMVLTGGAAAVLQKPVSRGQLNSALDHLGLHPGAERIHTVLVVDDDPKAVEVMAAFLAAPGYAVVRAYGGAEAIILAQRLQPDLIVLDLMMPEVSGFDVVETLQRDAGTARIPILVVTAKQITAEDRAALNRSPDKVIHIVEKAGFDRLRFVIEVRRALSPDMWPH